MKSKQNPVYHLVSITLLILFFSSCHQTGEPSSWNIDTPDFIQNLKVSSDISKVLIQHPTKASILEVATGHELMSFDHSPIPLENIDWSPDETEVLTLDREGNLKVWDATTGQLKHLLLYDILTYSYSHPFLQYSPYSKNYILVVDSRWDPVNSRWRTDLTPNVALWDLNQGKMYEFPWMYNPIFSKDGTKLLLLGSKDHKIHIFSLDQKKLIAEIGTDEAEATFSEDETKVISLTTTPHAMNVWDAQSGKLLFKKSLEDISDVDKTWDTYGLSPDGKYFHVGTSDHRLPLFRITIGQGSNGGVELTETLKLYSRAHLFSPDGRWVYEAAGTDDGTSHILWSFQTSNFRKLSFAGGSDHAIFSKDGKWLILALGKRIRGYELSRFSSEMEDPLTK